MHFEGFGFEYKGIEVNFDNTSVLYSILNFMLRTKKKSILKSKVEHISKSVARTLHIKVNTKVHTKVHTKVKIEVQRLQLESLS